MWKILAAKAALAVFERLVVWADYKLRKEGVRPKRSHPEDG